MSPEQNTINANLIVEEALNRKNVAMLAQFVAPGAVDHMAPPGEKPTLESTQKMLTGLFSAFPDLKYKVEFTVAEGDCVVQYVNAHGTMRGSFNGMPATNKDATWNEIHISQFDKNGKVIEHWATIDQLGMLQQLGFIQSR